MDSWSIMPRSNVLMFAVNTSLQYVNRLHDPQSSRSYQSITPQLKRSASRVDVA